MSVTVNKHLPSPRKPGPQIELDTRLYDADPAEGLSWPYACLCVGDDLRLFVSRREDAERLAEQLTRIAAHLAGTREVVAR